MQKDEIHIMFFKARKKTRKPRRGSTNSSEDLTKEYNAKLETKQGYSKKRGRPFNSIVASKPCKVQKCRLPSFFKNADPSVAKNSNLTSNEC